MMMKTAALDQTIKVKFFYSYSSEDKEWLNKLKAHMSIFRRTGEIDVDEVDFKNMSPGKKWHETICNDLNSADIVLLLISPSFLASDYCFTELEIALELMEKDLLRVIPIYIHYCLNKIAVLEKLSWLPSREYPIVGSGYWPSENKAYLEVVEGLDKVIEEVKIEKKRESTNKKNKTGTNKTPQKNQKIGSTTSRAKRREEVIDEIKTGKNNRESSQGKKDQKKLPDQLEETQRTVSKTIKEPKKPKEKDQEPKDSNLILVKSEEKKPGILKEALLVAFISSVFLISVFVIFYFLKNDSSSDKKSATPLNKFNRHVVEVDYPSTLDLKLSIKRYAQNLDMNLCSSSNEIIASSTSKNSIEKISQIVDKGKYYVDVILADDATGSEYELTIKRTPLRPRSKPDPDHSKEIAIPLHPPLTLKDKIFLQTRINSERYTFDVERTSIVEIDITIGASFNVDLQDSQKRTLFSIPNCKQGTIIRKELHKGKYFVIVQSEEGFYSEDYDIQINFKEDPSSGFIKKEL
jgi:hypothetical protein